MNKIEAFIGSGIIEIYCLGFTNHEENNQVQVMAAAYPLVQAEIDKLRLAFSQQLFFPEIKPSPLVKKSLMSRVYQQQSGIDKRFLPLLNQVKNFKELNEFVVINKLNDVEENVEEILVKDLPSTKEIVNFAVWAKNGQSEEVHHDMNEYIAVMTGSCDMYFGTVKKSYTKGEVIFIPPHVPHKAVITSGGQMFALVQRQMIAE
ncbi:MAG: cupin domain-containing protein [Ferruginibacter sp.]